METKGEYNAGELPLCPHCGSKADQTYKNYYGDRFFTCSNRHCVSGVMIIERVWRSRPLEDALRQRAETAEEELVQAKKDLAYFANKDIITALEEVSRLRAELEGIANAVLPVALVASPREAKLLVKIENRARAALEAKP